MIFGTQTAFPSLINTPGLSHRSVTNDACTHVFSLSLTLPFQAHWGVAKVECLNIKGWRYKPILLLSSGTLHHVYCPTPPVTSGARQQCNASAPGPPSGVKNNNNSDLLSRYLYLFPPQCKITQPLNTYYSYYLGIVVSASLSSRHNNSASNNKACCWCAYCCPHLEISVLANVALRVCCGPCPICLFVKVLCCSVISGLPRKT